MALLSELFVNAIWGGQKFEKGAKASSKQVKAFEGAIKTAKRTLATFGVALSATAFVSFARNQLDALESLGLVSEKLNINVERLQAYQFHANKSQISTNSLNTALQRMVRRVSEAAQGSGEAKDALRELGVSAQFLATQRADIQFERIAKAFQQINKQDRVRLAFKIFDTEGVGLVNMFADGVTKARAEYEKLGIAASKSDIKRATEAQAKFALAAAQLTAAGRQFAIDVAPALIEIMGGISSIVSNLQQLPGQTDDGTGMLRRKDVSDLTLARALARQGNETITIGRTTIGPEQPLTARDLQLIRAMSNPDRQILN